MTDKTVRPQFQPAPRPRPLNDGATTQALREATRDLGFGRTSSDLSSKAPEPAPRPEPTILAPPPPPPQDLAARPEPKPRVVKPAPVAPVAAAQAADRNTSIKFEIDEALATALKYEAVRRRVTVKYLILEALAAKDFPVDLASQPEDGRRIRK